MKYVDPSINYEDSARAWAKLLDKPFDTHGRPFQLCMDLLQTLFYDVYPETIEFIESDPQEFAATVAHYRHHFSTQQEGE